MLLSLLLILMICYPKNEGLAQTKPIKQGDAAPYDGILFSIDEGNKLRFKLLDLDFYIKQNESLNKSLDLSMNKSDLIEQKNKILVDQNINLAKSLNDQRGMSTFEHIMWFGLGSLVTVGIAYGVRQAIK